MCIKMPKTIACYFKPDETMRGGKCPRPARISLWAQTGNNCAACSGPQRHLSSGPPATKGYTASKWPLTVPAQQYASPKSSCLHWLRYHQGLQSGKPYKIYLPTSFIRYSSSRHTLISTFRPNQATMTQGSLKITSVFRLVVAILALSASSVLSIHAQPYQPSCVSYPIYASLEGRGLYIHGGFRIYEDEGISDETYVIDLSESWNVDNPKYKQLSPRSGGIFSARSRGTFSPSGITADGELWTTIYSQEAMQYNTTSNSWYHLFETHLVNTRGHTGATDHATDMMYIPFGYHNAKRQGIMWRVNLRTGETSSDGRVCPLSQEYAYATAWNPLRKSLIYSSADGVFEYTWKDGWKPFFSKGLGVPSVWSCLVSVSGGTKMALFGGLTDLTEDAAVIGDIYVLDLTKKGEERWTKAPITSKQRSEIARHGPACGSTGDQVIVSGGNHIIPNGTQCPKQRTLVFNVKTMKWTNRYVAPGKK